jgi:ribosomal protein S6--L-glutamate ligase
MSIKKTVGRFEKVDLPELGLFSMDAKIDTGADGSSIHCHNIELDKGKKTVTFNLLDPSHLDYNEKKITMPVHRMRWVTSSTGHREYRVYIKSSIVVLGESYEIELSLTDRTTMKFPMLLGRKFLHNRFLVDVSKQGAGQEGRVKIGILSLAPNLYSTKRLYEAAKKRGWEVEIINYLNCTTSIERENLTVRFNGRELNDLDAIIPRIGASRTFFGTAVVRQFELMNVFACNSSMAITRSRDKLRSHQILAKHGIDMPRTLFAAKVDDVDEIIRNVGGTPLVIKMLEGTQGIGVVLAETQNAAKSVLEAFYGLKINLLVQEYIEEAKGADIRVLVVGGKVVAAMKRQGLEGEFRSNIHRGGSAKPIKLSREEKSLAIKAAKVTGLAVAGVDMLQSARGPLLMEVNSSPGLEGIEKATGIDVADKIMDYIEQGLQKTVRTSDRIGT